MKSSKLAVETSAELKPCPFCGGEAKKKAEGLSEVYAYANQITYSCKSCGCSRSAIGDTSKGGYADNSTTEERALASWNNRFSAPVSEES